MRSKSTDRVLIKCGFCAAILVLTVIPVRGHFVRVHAQPGAPAIIVPYTVILEQHHAEANRAIGGDVTITQALRSDGSRVFQTVTHTANPPIVERMIDFSSGKHMTIMDLTKRKSTFFVTSASGIPWLRSSAENCVTPVGAQLEKLIAIENVEGYRAARRVRGILTSWYAIDYGCALIREHWQWDAGDTNDTRLVKLIPGEPSADIFADPADYQELPPSGLYGKATSQMSRADASYYSHQRH